MPEKSRKLPTTNSIKEPLTKPPNHMNAMKQPTKNKIKKPLKSSDIKNHQQ
ncbi:MAG: hypothetical protein JW778_00925 [Candidatus Altiarchaeota archaeon]|nr:hypothetical protein [Candidatus Altiarchaeota archaeon]